MDRKSLRTKFGGLGASVLLRNWMSTVDFQIAMYDHRVDPVSADYDGSQVILVFWHEYLTSPFYLRGRSNTAILTSRHRDAEWLSEAARHMGFETVRGSSYRGGAKALLKLVRSIRGRNIGIASDGPRGPRRKLALGPIYLSSRLGIPLVAFATGYQKPWRMRSWDCFAIPRPFSRARIISGPPMQIPPDLNRDSIEHYRQKVEDLLNRLTLEAEAWSAAGTRKARQMPIRREAPPARRSRRAA